MCGIAGILSPDPGAAASVDRMLDALGHRGPDGRGVATAGHATFGHCRLAIHDLTPAGAQPFVDTAHGLVSVANGEFYDYALLRDSLVMRGHAFRGRSDSEVVIPLWREKGPALVHDLHGPFALAVADARAGTLFLARDRVGKKPLFWARSGGRVLFSSELGALRRELEAPLRRRAVVDVLRMGYVPAPATPFEGIRSVPPGGAVLVQGGEVLERTWWTPSAAIDEKIDAASAADLVKEQLRAAVERRLSSERPIGALLSGGLDSAAVLMLANEIAPAPLPAFTLGFDDEVDETPFARSVARALGSPHTVFRFEDDPAAVLRDLVSETG